MAIDLSSITSNVQSASNIILVTPNKNIGIVAQDTADESFLFHILGDETATLQSEITDHFVENNSAIQDQIALKPEMITTNGFIGELNNVTPPALEPLKAAADKLSLISPFVPSLSSSAMIAYNQALQAYQTADAAAQALVSAFTSLSGLGQGQTKQQAAFNKFYAWWKNRQLFTVQTPWCIFKDMAILSLRATQAEDTRMITDFEISFKQMRFAQSVTTSRKPTSQGRRAAQASDVVNQGPDQLSPGPSLSSALGGG